jgi:hypothetical protein
VILDPCTECSCANLGHSDDLKDSFCEQLGQVLGLFPKASTYVTKVWLFTFAVSDAGTFNLIGPKNACI